MALSQPTSRSGSRLSDLGRVLSRQNDLLLAALLVAVVALLVLPLPTAMLDLLIATNLALSLVLLIVAMYVPSALSLSTFPSLLLFTTLFRLALNIASTKLILLHADAGHIIHTFGKLIVGNNVVVGGVVFLIIAIVQFIVIAKGSERVAEVAARFALDAMPGKQMSIDADVRAGVLSSAEAQRRRQLLEQECQLHGAMDGSMKFVKGDAIASIIIAIVNILAGVTIGTLMLGMDLGAAVQRFSILTVGDGMVSQIPSLLISMAAGIVITRVTSSQQDEPPQLAQQIVGQLVAQPRAWIIAGVAIAAFLLVPGFPKWVFGGLAALTLGVGLAMRARMRRRRTPEWIEHGGAAREAGDSDGTAVAAPLALHLGTGLDAALDRHLLDLRLSAAKIELEAELGPVFPRLFIGALPPGGEAFAYDLLVQDVRVARGLLHPGLRMLEPGDALAPPAGAMVEEPFGPFRRVVWAPEAQVRGLASIPPEEVIARHAAHVVRLNAPRMIGMQEVQRLLRIVQQDAPDVAAEVARTVPVQRMGEVLRRLLQEGIPIRNLRGIFESLLIWAPKETDPITLTEMVRIDLGRYITSLHVDASRMLGALMFESALLDRVEKAIDRSPRGNLLLLSPAVTQDIRDQVRRALSAAAGPVVAVTSTEVRRYVKTLLEPVAPELTVLSYQEVDDDVAMQPVGWITNPRMA